MPSRLQSSSKFGSRPWVRSAKRGTIASGGGQGEWSLTREVGRYMFLRKSEVKIGNAGQCRHGLGTGQDHTQAAHGSGNGRICTGPLLGLSTCPSPLDLLERERKTPKTWRDHFEAHGLCSQPSLPAYSALLRWRGWLAVTRAWKQRNKIARRQTVRPRACLTADSPNKVGRKVTT
jgi:hypothetical protein